MNKTKPDRRIKRTRQLLRDALTALIMEKDYDKITVQDIIDRANVGRSTFYTHFIDKDDLLLGEMSVFRIGLAEHFETKEEMENPLRTTAIFIHVAENYPLYRAMIGTQGIELAHRMAQNKMSEHLEQRINQLIAGGHPIPLPAPIITQYLTGALLNLIAWWLEEKMPFTPEEMDAMFQQMAMVGLERLITDAHEKD